MKNAPPSGTSYTAAKPAPPQQAISSRCWARLSPAQRPATPPSTPPIVLGAASRPRDAPRPMTTSEMTPVPSERRNDSSPRLAQMTSSSSVRSPSVNRRSRYQARPPMPPATSRQHHASRAARPHDRGLVVPGAEGEALDVEQQAHQCDRPAGRWPPTRRPGPPRTAATARSRRRRWRWAARSRRAGTAGGCAAPAPVAGPVRTGAAGVRSDAAVASASNPSGRSRVDDARSPAGAREALVYRVKIA